MKKFGHSNANCRLWQLHAHPGLSPCVFDFPKADMKPAYEILLPSECEFRAML